MLRLDPESMIAPPASSVELAAWHRDSRLERADALRDRLRRDAESGALCGAPLGGPYLDALFALLERLGWEPSYEALAGAMPHYPKSFGLDAMREVLARLGFPSRVLRRRPSEVSSQHLPALHMRGDPCLVVPGAQGPEALDPGGSAAAPLRARGRIRLICFGPAIRTAEAPPRAWFADTLRRLSGTMAWMLGLTFVINSVILLASLAIMAIYDLVLPTSALDTLVAILIGALLVVGLDIALRRIRARLVGHLAGRIEYALTTALFAKVLSLPADRLTSAPASSQVSRLKQFEAIRENVAGQFATVVMELPFALLFCGVLMALVGPVGAVSLGVVLLVTCAGVALFPLARKRSGEAQRARTAYNEIVLDMLANLTTLRNLGCEDIWARRLDEAAVAAARARGRSVELGRVISALSAIAAPLAGGATVAVGAIQVLEGSISTGALVTCMLVVWRIITPFQQAVMLVPRVPVLLNLVRQVDTLMAMPSEGASAPSAPHAASARPGRITLRQVTFRYPGASEAAIGGLDLDVPSGEFLSVTGPSGAGKTTLLQLMQGLHTPFAGIVGLDGRNLRQIPLPDLRGAVGLVRQRPEFLHGTILQNLRLGAPTATVAEVEALLDELGLLPLLRDLPEGLDTRLTETRQSELSRGARQTLALCRTLLRKPRVLLLDEPAQSLDQDLDNALLGAISARMRRMTIVMVSHRPSHIRLADRVLVLQRGRISDLRTNDQPLEVAP